MDTSGIGRRIAYWRGRRRLTQAEFGALMGKSRRWVQDIEGGQRQSDPRLSVLERAAEVLHVRLETLLSDRDMRADTECVDAAELVEIRATLHRHDVLTGAFVEPDPVDMDALRRNVAYGWMAFQASDYSPLGRVLPPLIVDANRAAVQAGGDAQRSAHALLTLVYQLTVAAATKFGDDALAWHAADRAVMAAERSGDAVAIAGAARHLCDAMFHRGNSREAVDFATATASRHERDLVRSSQGLSVLGMLYLKASMAAAHAEHRSDVPGLLDAAGDAAERLGVDGNALWTAFGPTNVSIHRVSALVRMNDGTDAMAAAAQIEQTGLNALPRERRALYLVDVARGLTQAGRREEAVTKLFEAEREAPEEVHCRPRTRRLVEDLRLLGAGSAEGRLRGLAGRCGLPA
ncbi:helix-turn-helix domain-containing protein [Streptomyces sp. 4503]|uniref:Helix-turn-helix domain-containing protein n=1 Tax=Streptomyces niphimycinicus TaxID=2842201 RepID=A0ABS6CMT2_9ACTN|nr:helix-turn-helix transcriptional regulator [Streptomyces niphimycinicus]MBU3868243.1 helix-turn-helix domain-containing protein [Streptomyces niphimycinicus]